MKGFRGDLIVVNPSWQSKDYMARLNSMGLKNFTGFKGFIEFLHNLPFYGLAVVCGDDSVVREIIPDIARPIVTYGLEGSVRRYMGQWEKAIDLLNTAMRLTGINKPWYPTVKACSLFVGGRVEQAATVAEMVLDYQPHNLEALLVLVAAQVELGMTRRAKATTEMIRTRFPSVDVKAWLDKSPYRMKALIERWKKDLASAGAIEVM